MEQTNRDAINELTDAMNRVASQQVRLEYAIVAYTKQVNLMVETTAAYLEQIRVMYEALRLKRRRWWQR
jgi:hypothetical protein